MRMTFRDLSDVKSLVTLVMDSLSTMQRAYLGLMDTFGPGHAAVRAGRTDLRKGVDLLLELFSEMNRLHDQCDEPECPMNGMAYAEATAKLRSVLDDLDEDAAKAMIQPVQASDPVSDLVTLLQSQGLNITGPVHIVETGEPGADGMGLYL